jgi:predicted nucleotidyltransferase
VDERLADAVDTLRGAGAAFGFVFGSRARGDARPGADLDLAAWWPTTPPEPWDVQLPPGVDLLVLNGAPLELAGRVALEGQLAFDDDPPARVRWLADTRKIWLDERPRVAAAHRTFLEAAARGR